MVKLCKANVTSDFTAYEVQQFQHQLNLKNDFTALTAYFMYIVLFLFLRAFSKMLQGFMQDNFYKNILINLFVIP